jgi:hypothetical protein
MRGHSRMRDRFARASDFQKFAEFLDLASAMVF